MRSSTVVALAFAALLAAPTALAQEEAPPAEAEPPPAPPAPPPSPEAKQADLPPTEAKERGMRLALDLSFARSNGEAADRVSAHSPSLIPLGADVSWRTSAKVLLGVHGHFGLASRDDCLGDSGCTGRTYALGAHIEGAFLTHGVFVPYIRYGIGWEMLHQKGMYKNPDGYRYAHGLDLLDVRFGGDFRLSPTARLGPFIGMIGGIGLHEDRAPAQERSLDSGHMWFFVGARGTLDI